MMIQSTPLINIGKPRVSRTWNIDNLLDGLKEGRIKLEEFGQEVPKATKELLADTDISAKQLQEWGKAVAKGGETGRDAMQEVTKALLGVKDETTRNALGVQIFGTMWEDQGTNITDTLLNMDQHLSSSKENMDSLKSATSQLDASPAVEMKQAISDMKVALEPLLLLIADLITKLAEWISNNPQLAATITAIVTAIGILIGLCLALAPIFITLSGVAAALGVSVGAVAAPVLAVIGVIAALIAIGIALWQNWDTISAKASEIWGWLETFFSDFWSSTLSIFNSALDWIDQVTNGKFSALTDAIRSYLQMADRNIKDYWNYIKSTFQNALDFIVALVTGDFEGMKNAVENQLGNIEELIENIWGNVEDFLGGIDLSSIGENIMQGLVNGLKNVPIVGEIANLVGSAITAAKEKLGIHSPSRVFMEIGEYTGEGFAIGIDSMLGDIQKASQNMAEVSIPNVRKIDLPDVKTKSNKTEDNKGQVNQFNFERMLEGAQFIVREEADIAKIAKQLGDYIKMNARKNGVVI